MDVNSPDEFKQIIVGARTSLLKLKVIIEDLIAENDKVVAEADLYFRIQELADYQTDQAIADQLNAEGYQTAYKHSWTAPMS